MPILQPSLETGGQTAALRRDPSGEMNELMAQIDISTDPTLGVAFPAHGDTVTMPNGDVWRIQNWDDLQFGMVALAVRKLLE